MSFVICHAMAVDGGIVCAFPCLARCYLSCGMVDCARGVLKDWFGKVVEDNAIDDEVVDNVLHEL